MAYSHVAHDCRIGNQIVLSNVATLGAMWRSAISRSWADCRQCISFTKVGAYCFIANNAAVTRTCRRMSWPSGSRRNLTASMRWV